MNIEKINAPSANITLPLNQSVQQANAAQFAMMLSLMMEPRSAPSSTSAVQIGGPSAVTAQQTPPNFNLETSQTRALHQNQMHHFHLMHSLYEERVIPVDEALQLAGNNSSDVADAVLQEIGQGHSAGSMADRAAEKVSFAA